MPTALASPATPPHPIAAPPRVSPPPRATAIAAADSHGCAIADDGSVQCWGRNAGGALGTGRTEGEESSPVRVPGIEGVRALAVDRLRTCVVHGEGRVHCWGDDLAFERDGQWLSGGTTTPRPSFGITDAVAVAFGARDACALRADGTARCWGDVDSPLRKAAGARDGDPFYAPRVPANTTALALGGGHACAIDRDGAAWCWGPGTDGQLGNGDTRSRSKPTRVVGVGTFRAIAATNAISCGVSTDGALWCWGGTRCPKMGDCSHADVAFVRPRAIAVSATLVDVALSPAGGVLLDDDGHAWAFDPISAMDPRFPPRRIVGVDDLVEVAIGSETCGRTRDGAVLCWPRGALEVTPRALPMRAP